MAISLARPRSTLVAACGAHLTQDGLVALQYVLLPIVAQVFSLSYAQVGLLRAVSNTAMSVLELPAGLLAERMGERKLLAAGLVGAGVGYLCVAYSNSFYGVVAGFFIAGSGAAFQHSLASSVLVRRFEGGARRKALGIYNASGDAGKLTFTAAFSAAVGAGLTWNASITLLAVPCLVFAGVLVWLLRPTSEASSSVSDNGATDGARLRGWGIQDLPKFSALCAMVFFDSVVQAVFLTFLAFIMKAKGASDGVAGTAVVLALAGGMVGKFACGFAAARLGDRATFILVQLFTVIGFLALALLDAVAALVVLPLIGLVVQGSTTVSYGSVADFVKPRYQARGYALIYSFSAGSAVVGPIALGGLADVSGLNAVLWVLILLTLLTLLFARVLPNKESVRLAEGVG